MAVYAFEVYSSEGMILFFYKKWLQKHTNKWWSKPLGLCPDCFNVWVTISLLGLSFICLKIVLFICLIGLSTFTLKKVFQ
jgi:disulfide bond formation protein DsbB